MPAFSCAVEVIARAIYILCPFLHFSPTTVSIIILSAVLLLYALPTVLPERQAFLRSWLFMHLWLTVSVGCLQWPMQLAILQAVAAAAGSNAVKHGSEVSEAALPAVKEKWLSAENEMAGTSLQRGVCLLSMLIRYLAAASHGWNLAVAGGWGLSVTQLTISDVSLSSLRRYVLSVIFIDSISVHFWWHSLPAACSFCICCADDTFSDWKNDATFVTVLSADDY